MTKTWDKAVILIIAPDEERKGVNRKEVKETFPNWKACFWRGEVAFHVFQVSVSMVVMKFLFLFIIDYFSVLEKYWLIRWIQASVRSTALTSNPFPLIKGNRVNLINAY